MENENQEQVIAQTEQKSTLHQVTPLSKYLAMVLFVILPFVGGYIGYVFAPEKIVEVEKEVIREVVIHDETEVSGVSNQPPAYTDTPGGGFGVLESKKEDKIYFVAGDNVVKRDIVTGQEETIYTETDPSLSLVEDAGINGSWGNITFGAFEEYLLIARFNAELLGENGMMFPAERFVDVVLIDLK